MRKTPSFTHFSNGCMTGVRVRIVECISLSNQWTDLSCLAVLRPRQQRQIDSKALASAWLSCQWRCFPLSVPPNPFIPRAVHVQKVALEKGFNMPQPGTFCSAVPPVPLRHFWLSRLQSCKDTTAILWMRPPPPPGPFSFLFLFFPQVFWDSHPSRVAIKKLPCRSFSVATPQFPL